MKKSLLRIALLALAPLVAGAADPEGPRTYALVSAIGSTMTYVKPRMSTGTHMGEFQRAEMTVPGVGLDMAALRGLETTIRLSEPQARVEYLRLNPDELKGVNAPQRGSTAVGKLATALKKLPGRDKWYQILIVTPRYVANEHNGMGSKLQGIGIYVQNLDKGIVDGAGMGGTNFLYETITPDGKPSDTPATAYIAPFFYAQVWVLDAKTLEVLQVTERFDLQRISDPTSSAINIEKAVPPEKLGPLVETFVEKAAEKAAREAIGVVTVGEPKVVKPN